jgi:hypothetical protein
MRQAVDFVLFILVAAILFIRPNDFVPGLESIPLYLIAIVPCIILSWHKLVPQLTTVGLRERPVFVSGIGILLVSVVSNVAYRRLEIGFDFAVEFSKVLIFYLLMLAHLDSPRRLKLFLACLVGIIMIPIVLVVLNYYNIIQIDGFVAIIDTNVGVGRLGGSWVFGDPNDMCEILNCAMIFSLCGLLDRGGGCTRVIWLAPVALFGHALSLTQSRGGFLGAMVGLMVLLRGRFRGMKWLLLAGMGLALMFVLFGDRQTSLSTSEASGQSRIQLWNAGFGLLQRSVVSPLIGVGTGQFAFNLGHVAHNAFMQMYTELGFLGGTLFFGQYYYCLTNLAKLGSTKITVPDPEMRRGRPFLMASLASFAASEMSLTNPCNLITYVMLGLPTVFIRLADPRPPLPDLLLNGRLVRRMTLYSGLFLLGLYVFTKLSVRFE